MVEIRESEPTELARFCEMERAADTREYITVSSLQAHRQQFARPDIVYLSIYTDAGLAGYIILALEGDGETVEFRRIVVADKGRGIGRAAISAMEGYCRGRLRRRRIWLDVFESNHRGRHVYEKLGYRLFDTGELRGQKLLLLQKDIAAIPGVAD